MTRFEDSVEALRSALDALEVRLGERLADLGHNQDAVDAARRQARAARAFAGEAADELALAIDGLKSILDSPSMPREPEGEV